MGVVGAGACDAGQGRIGILASNRLEWVLLDLAALRLGAVTAGFEPGKFDPDPALLDRYSLSVLFTDRPADGRRIRPITDVGSLISEASPGIVHTWIMAGSATSWPCPDPAA